MTDRALPTAVRLLTGLASHDPQPQVAQSETWHIVHVGTADTPQRGAQALMRTSDGDFRISAAEVDGKVSLRIERLLPQGTPDGSGICVEERGHDRARDDDVGGSALAPEAA